MKNLDKVTHGAICAAIVLYFQRMIEIPMESFWLPLLIASIVAAIVGVGKEWFDWARNGKGNFDKGDLIADGVGILLADLGLIFLWYCAL